MAKISVQGDFNNLPQIGSTSWGPAFPFVPPVDSDFAWINQGGATITDLGGALALSAPAGSGNNLRIRKKAAPATPYTIDVAFLCNLTMNDFYEAGFLWRQSSDGKLVTTYVQSGNSTNKIAVGKWNSATSFSADYTSVGTGIGFYMYFMRAVDNGTNRIMSVSADYQTWIQLHSVGRTDFMTADEVGFFLDCNCTFFNQTMTLVSWKQS